MKIRTLALALSGIGLSFALSPAVMAEGASGPHVQYTVQGHIGEVVVNPYRIAPLTAVIRNGGYEISNATVRIVPKNGGQEIKYAVGNSELLTHSGIPVVGLYPDYTNTVEVSYDRKFNGKTEHFKESYQFWVPPIYTASNGTPDQLGNMFDAKVEKTSAEFSDRLYLVNNLLRSMPQGSQVVWNNPTGGAIEWNFYPQVAILDSKGAVRWYLEPSSIYDNQTIYHSGVMMGFRQTSDGAFTWGYGQRYVKYDLLGREIFNRRLPEGYVDFSHSLDPAQNGHLFIRAASGDYRRLDQKRVRTVRDLIVEVDENGRVVDTFKLAEILDPFRDTVIKVLDQGAVCLNIDMSKAGQTLSAEELAKQDQSDKFGDVVGVGAGRNWAHVNSVDYDQTDDSIIISSRHQSAAIKIGRDKKVKWILGAPDGWKGDFAKKVLKPVDKDGKAIPCEAGKCEGGFDWSWTQHTAFRIDSKSDKRYVYLTVFDNGDGRGLDQPALPTMKYSRGVIYKIDQEKMTVEQIWEHGKEQGADYYSPVTGLCEYQKDKDSVVVYYSTAGFAGEWGSKSVAAAMHPYITEFKYGEKDPSVVIKLNGTFGYQAFPISLEKAMGHVEGK